MEQAEICLVEYTEKKQAVDATTVEVTNTSNDPPLALRHLTLHLLLPNCTLTVNSPQVKFVKQCEKQMVTVCQPQPSYGPSYHTVQHCKEVTLDNTVQH